MFHPFKIRGFFRGGPPSIGYTLYGSSLYNVHEASGTLVDHREAEYVAWDEQGM